VHRSGEITLEQFVGERGEVWGAEKSSGGLGLDVVLG